METLLEIKLHFFWKAGLMVLQFNAFEPVILQVFLIVFVNIVLPVTPPRFLL